MSYIKKIEWKYIVGVVVLAIMILLEQISNQDTLLAVGVFQVYCGVYNLSYGCCVTGSSVHGYTKLPWYSFNKSP